MKQTGFAHESWTMFMYKSSVCYVTMVIPLRRYEV